MSTDSSKGNSFLGFWNPGQKQEQDLSTTLVANAGADSNRQENTVPLTTGI